MARPSTSEFAPRQRGKLGALVRKIEACRICRDDPAVTPLPHEPRPVVRPSATARLLIAGQAPGVRVHNSGLPFNDPSGDRLREWMQVDRETFYDASRIAIVPMGFCFPGHDKNKGDLPPRRECRATWHDAIFELMPQLEVVLAIGSHAHAYHMSRLGLPWQRGTPMNETVANWREYAAQRPAVFALPHPSWRNTGWLKKNPWFETDVLPQLRAAVAACL
ncbi:MAG: uracil-DNA glycosylase family protein [Beijerinckiaceae bacterium]